MSEAKVIKQDNSEFERIAAQSAKAKASAEMWSADILIFLLSVFCF